jgi:hypothetical protein
VGKVYQFGSKFISHVVKRDMHTIHIRESVPPDGSEINPHDLMLGYEYTRFNTKGKYKRYGFPGKNKRR